MQRINWTVEDAAELHASVLIAAAAACSLSNQKTELFLRHIAQTLAENAECTSPHVGSALLLISEMLCQTAPARVMDVQPMLKRAN